MRLIEDKEAQLVILNALDVVICGCECESKYIKRLIIQLENELQKLRNKT